MHTNFWKRSAALVTRSRTRLLLRRLFEVLGSPWVTNFLLSFFIFLVAYACIEILLEPDFQYPSLYTEGYSLADVLLFLQSHLGKRLWEAAGGIQIIVLLVMTLSAYLFTTLAMIPLHLATKREHFFAVNAAHELATPLSIIKTTAEVAQMRSYRLSQEELSRLTVSVVEEVDRMAEVVKYFLHFTTPKKQTLMMTTVNLSKILRASTRKLTHFAQEKSLIFDLPDRAPRKVWGNAAALEEMTLSILKNAIAYSRAKETVRLSLKEKPSAVELTVSVNGTGIPADDLPHLFDPFYRGATTQVGASGMSLVIAQEIAKLHLAEISVRNEFDGLVFTVCLPK